MRIVVYGNIIENNQINFSTNFNHQIYSTFLNNINIETAKRLHKKGKEGRFKRLFTFSTLYIKDSNVHFYVAGEDNLIKDFINNIVKNQIINIDNIIINVTKIDQLENLKEKESYNFKTDFIVNERQNGLKGKACLSKDFDYIKERINQIAKDKYKDIYGEDIEENINVKFLDCKKVYTTYKNFHLNSYKAKVQLSGSFKLINLIYQVGLGENTSSGHGFCWEMV